jgi:predicted flavoprotein YhiN
MNGTAAPTLGVCCTSEMLDRRALIGGYPLTAFAAAWRACHDTPD